MIPKSNDMRFEVTTRCNYNCVICPRDKLTRKIETMSFELFRRILDKILDETGQYNTLSFPGLGEPLLDETLDRKIEYAKKKKLDILILTNGSLLSVDRFKALEGLGVTSLRISFYGNTPAAYSKVHGLKNKEIFNKVRANLTEISKIKKQTKLLFTFNVVDGINESCVKGWIEYWKDKADLIEVWRPHNWVDGKDYRKVQKALLATCGRPFNGPLQVQADGSVNMCCFDFNGKLTLGDLKNETLGAIFDSPLYRKIKECHAAGKFKGSGLICEKCDQRNAVKSDAMVFNSKFDIAERLKMTSTTYSKVIG